MIRTAVVTFLFLAVAPALAALELPVTAREQAERISPLDSYALPIGPFADGAIPAELIEGRIERRSWRIDGGSSTTLQMLAPLRAQIAAQGYETIFECADKACGGFDFRFGTEVLPGPHMYVDLGDFRFLSARRAPGDVQSLLISRTAASVYVQQIIATEVTQEQGIPVVLPTETPVAPLAEDLVSRLMAQGHVVLSDLEFRTGANELGDGPFASLEALSGFIDTHDDYRLVFVGHTDSVGRLSANIALSKSRAEAVRARMLRDFDVSGDRIEAEGMGYLAPIASNLTKAGREANRRVEVILLPK
ncbi:OmpA family protein [Phaeobacter marinintestinus]|uniref:OmpA family protein n=1 Tax=Falsiphaeobacter marinintestinus TaxID=1492905 RepID=UPI0011B70644|nr:OmpA family protein [Phaeobacter marinintestinus]